MAKFEAIEKRDGTVYVYEDGIYIGTINLCDFPLTGFARIMRAANEARLTRYAHRPETGAANADSESTSAIPGG